MADKCGRNWYACVTSHGHCSGGGAMLVWWPGGACTPWCESWRISNSNVGNHFIQVGRWITLCLWESQWVEKSRRLVPVGILRLIQLHGYFSSEVNLLACVNCYDQWGGRVHQEFWHCRIGKLPSPIGHAHVNRGGNSQPVFLTLVGNPMPLGGGLGPGLHPDGQVLGRRLGPMPQG